MSAVRRWSGRNEEVSFYSSPASLSLVMAVSGFCLPVAINMMVSTGHSCGFVLLELSSKSCPLLWEGTGVLSRASVTPSPHTNTHCRRAIAHVVAAYLRPHSATLSGRPPAAEKPSPYSQGRTPAGCRHRGLLHTPAARKRILLLLISQHFVSGVQASAVAPLARLCKLAAACRTGRSRP